MPLPTPIPQALTEESTCLEGPLEDVPSNVDMVFNGDGDGRSLKPGSSALSKAVDSGALDPDAIRRLSISTVSGLSDHGGSGRSNSHVSLSRCTSRSPTRPVTWCETFRQFSDRNRGLWLVTASQLFGSFMNVTTRLLELDGEGMHPFQVVFIRMGITVILCWAYMWYTKVPHFPLGKKEIRKLLVIRGLAGFFGMFGMYYSLLYLPLADATVITFLSPAVAGYGCYLLFNEPFTKTEQTASIISLLGVILIARPTSFFNLTTPTQDSPNPTTTGATDNGYAFPTPTSAQRFSAIAIALLGVAGAACAFTTLRWIGHRAHPLISVNYFAICCTLVSFAALAAGPYLPRGLVSPNGRFTLQASLKQWGMLVFLGGSGFVMQYMMTAGLSLEKSNRATSMVYTNMLFALLFDRWVFGTVPGVWSLLGSGLILGSAVYVAVQRGVGGAGGGVQEAGRGLLSDEETAVMGVDHVLDGDGNGEGQGLQLMEINIRDYDE